MAFVSRFSFGPTFTSAPPWSSSAFVTSVSLGHAELLHSKIKTLKTRDHFMLYTETVQWVLGVQDS